MRKLMLILLMFSALFTLKSNAQETSFPRFTFGAEWSYIYTVHSIWHYNFFSPEGYRVDMKGSETKYTANGEAYINAGYNFNEHWNIAMYIGIAGIGNIHKAVPFSFRGTYYFGDNPLSDRWFTYIEAGSGISLKIPPKEIFACKAGGGYRISLSRHSKLDFMLALKVTYTHPEIIYDEIRIDPQRINKNGMLMTSISLGMAINI